MNAIKRVAVVTGGNRGLGLETCRKLLKLNFRVMLTSRDLTSGQMAVSILKKFGEIECFQLDVTNWGGVEFLAQTVRDKFRRADVLINNAGVMDDNEKENSVLSASKESFLRALQTNTMAPIHLCQAFIPLMRLNHYGRIVNVSSELGQLTHMGGGYPAYRVSKAAVNAATKIFAEATSGQNILVNSVCPGWCRTRMGGDNAPRSAEAGADGIVWAATLPDGGPTGKFFKDGKELEW